MKTYTIQRVKEIAKAGVVIAAASMMTCGIIMSCEPAFALIKSTNARNAKVTKAYRDYVVPDEVNTKDGKAKKVWDLDSTRTDEIIAECYVDADGNDSVSLMNNPDHLSTEEIVRQNAMQEETDSQRAFHQMLAEQDGRDTAIGFDDAGTAYALYDYISTNYSFCGQGRNADIDVFISRNGDYCVTPPAEDRAETVENVLHTIYAARGSSDLSTAENVVRSVNGFYNYDLESEYASMDQSLSTQRGVCYHYSHAAYVLLNYEGIPTRLATGTCGYELHSWCVSRIGMKQYLIDPTAGTIYEGIPAEYREGDTTGSALISK